MLPQFPPLKRRSGIRRGAAAVEMAIVLPVFLLIIFATVEFGRAFMVEHSLAEAARLGARKSICQGATNSQVEGLIKSYCLEQFGVSSSKIDVDITVGAVSPGNLSAANPGDLCTVTVSVSFDDADFIPGTFLGGATLSSSCTMERE